MNSGFLSLLPYLNPLNRLYLNIPLVSNDESALEKAVFPFRSISNTDPFCRLLEAEFLTDAGSTLKQVFLLVQRDRYLFVKDELQTLTNPQIAAAWQKAFSYYRKSGKGNITVFSDQLSETGQLCPYTSLFFCKAKRIFSHPSCRKCGSVLELGTDDDLLADFGLQPYSLSLERYLFCSKCIHSEKPDFYTYDIEKTRIPLLKDRWGLLHDFEQLVKDKIPAPQFSCTGCPEREFCYGNGKIFLSRLVPFSFYPFFMFGFEAMPLNAVDYLKLVSGSGFPEIKRDLYAKEEFGRLAAFETLEGESSGGISRLFGVGSFGETLYLKLSFLGEVVQKFLDERANIGDFSPRPVIDKIWVKPAENGNLLPLLWNFRLDLIDLGLKDPDYEWHSQEGLEQLHLLGRIWLYSLVFNSRQDLSFMHHLIKKGTKHKAAASSSPFDHNLDPGLHPANIFWDPQNKVVEQKWYPLWDRSLQIGWLILNPGRGEIALNKASLVGLIDSLRSEVRDLLFETGSNEAVLESSPSLQDGAIYGILEGILERWRAAASEKKQPLREEEELAETLILSVKEGAPVKVIKKQKPKPEDEMPETVIIAASTAPVDEKKGSAAASKMPSLEDSTCEKAKKKRMEKTDEDVFGDDVLAETIILRPEDIPERYKKS